MSEFQYYEFRTEMAEMRAVSSQGEISSSSYINTDDYGDFSGDPSDWMDRFFDSFLYHASWGTRELSFRLPKSVLSEGLDAEYRTDETLNYRTVNDQIILSISSPDEHQWQSSGS